MNSLAALSAPSVTQSNHQDFPEPLGGDVHLRLFIGFQIFCIGLIPASYGEPDAEALGKNQGYPRAPGVAEGSRDLYIVDSNSGGWESLIPTRRIENGRATPLFFQQSLLKSNIDLHSKN